MPNQLHLENSPYLRQHSLQEINWATWSNAALSRAKEEDKPILLSIGYSACHWCQTMSRENFEDSYVASLMNRHFVCILVDREERPDLDQLYMESVRMFNQSAGWPLHAFCLPNGKPFWGGTFFPKEDIGQGIAPWPQVLIRISEHYRTHKEELVENAENVSKNLIHANDADSENKDTWNAKLIVIATEKLCQLHDDKFGGFSSAPKFPASMKVDFLLSVLESQYIRNTKSIQSRINHCVEKTMDQMAMGGIFDHLDGGFFRYSRDENWSVPHFEKMILENSLLVSCFSRAFRKYKKPLYQKVISKTIQWLLDKTGDEKTGFPSSVSSESEGEEGKFYLWTQGELEEILGKDHSVKLIQKLNPIGGADSPLFLPQLSNEEDWDLNFVSNFSPKLELARSNRVPPETDPKRTLGVNAFMIKALCDSAIALKDKSLLEKACCLADWMKKSFLVEESFVPVLYPQNQNDKSNLEPVLDDLAYWAETLLHLACFSEIVRLESAEVFTDDAKFIIKQSELMFSDKVAPGYFHSASNAATPPPIRKKYWYDNSSPSGNSSLMRAFSLLYHHTKQEKWKLKYLEMRAGYPKLAQKNPEGISYALTAITDETIGIPTLSIPVKMLDECLIQLEMNPSRYLSILSNKSDDQCILSIGEKSYRTTSVADLFRILFN